MKKVFVWICISALLLTMLAGCAAPTSSPSSDSTAVTQSDGAEPSQAATSGEYA